jgi:hypothetical protein
LSHSQSESFKSVALWLWGTVTSLTNNLLQSIFAAIVLALSVVLINQYGPGHAPSLLDYGAFCGGAALVIAIVGIVACFIESLQGIIMLVLDGLATFFLLAGGIVSSGRILAIWSPFLIAYFQAFAASIKVGNCSNLLYYATIDTFAPSEQKWSTGQDGDLLNDVQNRCRMTQADTAFLWFTAACATAAVALSFMSHKSGGRGSLV